MKRDVKIAERKLRERDIYAMSAFGVDRVITWIRDPNRRPANTSFTAGPERQIAYAVEDALREASNWTLTVPSQQVIQYRVTVPCFCGVCGELMRGGVHMHVELREIRS